MKSKRYNLKRLLEAACYLFLEVDHILNIKLTDQILISGIWGKHCSHIEKIKAELFWDHQKQLRFWNRQYLSKLERVPLIVIRADWFLELGTPNEITILGQIQSEGIEPK
jgi:hypothetical protein